MTQKMRTFNMSAVDAIERAQAKALLAKVKEGVILSRSELNLLSKVARKDERNKEIEQDKGEDKQPKDAPHAHVALRPGRPTKYSPKLAAKICNYVARGWSSLKIARLEGMPDRTIVFDWLNKYRDFSDMYAKAKEDAADLMAEEIIDIADDGLNDTYTRKGPDGEETQAINYDHINRSRLRVDARKWVAAKLKPRKYSDRAGEQIAPTNASAIVRIYMPSNGRGPEIIAKDSADDHKP